MNVSKQEAAAAALILEIAQECELSIIEVQFVTRFRRTPPSSPSVESRVSVYHRYEKGPTGMSPPPSHYDNVWEALRSTKDALDAAVVRANVVRGVRREMQVRARSVLAAKGQK